jgi:GxxExxY protein
MSKLIVPDKWSNLVIGSCIEVHRALGPGYLESVYESGLDVQFRLDFNVSKLVDGVKRIVL